MTASRVHADPSDVAVVVAPVGSRSWAARVLVAAVRSYQVVVSPARPPTCRYWPSCSQYAIDSVSTWGVRRGVVLALRRLLRCHPWHAGGYDPVPQRGPARSDAADLDLV